MDRPGRSRDGSHASGMTDRLHSWDTVVIAVGLITALALLIRIVGLGTRPFHWDEARVGYWTLRYASTGVFEYRPVAGGPFLYHVNRWIFTFLPVTDFAARLVVALVGGLLPAVALLFRSRLRDDETVLLAIVLAGSPLLLYYSRFLRGDVPLAALSLLAIGLVVRWLDTDDPRFLWGAGVTGGLALATSGFVIATFVVVCIAWLLTFDHRRVGGAGTGAATALQAKLGFLRERTLTVLQAFLVLLVTVFLTYAPRGHGLGTDPGALLFRTFLAPIDAFIGVRVLNRAGTEFLPFVTEGATVVASTSGPLFVVALVGFLADRYGVVAVDRPARPIVALTSLWAGLGLLAYPLASEVLAPWMMVHVLVPLSIPAAVGLAAIVRYGRRAALRGDTARIAAATLLLIAVGVHGGVVLAEGVSGDQDAENPFVHYAQPTDDLEPLVAEMTDAIAAAEGDDARVVWIGDRFYVPNEDALTHPDVADDREAFSERLPLAWYVERTGARTHSEPTADALDGQPAVVIAEPSAADAVEASLDGHDRHEVALALWDREAVIFIGN